MIGLKYTSSWYYFENIIISEEYNLTKPNKKIFEVAEQLSNSKPENNLMIDDNFKSDIIGALNAGWKAIWLTDENERKDWISINNLLELKSLL